MYYYILLTLKIYFAEFVGGLALQHMKNLHHFKDDIPVIGIEMYAVAAVIVVLKAYWGLNDDSELRLSDAVKKINGVLIKKNSSYAPLFCWEDWQR